MTLLIITLPHTWTWIKNMQLRPPSENLINFGLSASDVSCIVSIWGFAESQTACYNCLQPSLVVWKIHLQMLRSHPRRQDIMPPIAILLIPKEMVVKVQDLRGLKSTFQLTAQTSSGVILLEWILLDLKVASTSTTGHGESVVQKVHDQVKRSVMLQKET